MNYWKQEWKSFLTITTVFLICYYLPVGTPRFDNAIIEAFHLVKWYAQEHVLLCLIPAFFIAGAIGVFVSQASVMKYLGAKANKVLAYGVASVSGTILAVCSCTILPLFSGIYKMGAGLGPACAFLYSGPAINVLAVVLTARILGPELGIARALGAIFLSIIIGYSMHLLFRKEEEAKLAAQMMMPEPEVKRALWQDSLYFGSMVFILVFANWGKPQAETGLWANIYEQKWVLTSISGFALGIMLVGWFGLKAWKAIFTGVASATLAFMFPTEPLIAFTAGTLGLTVFTSTDDGELGEWFSSSYEFAKQILPLLLFGVLVAGVLLGRVGNEGLIPSEWIAAAVGGNSIISNFLASIVGAFMYF
ncbi:MAG: permease, partial [Candidatus Riflebacteria bacterium]|nr:permease [Candidatus Riflebacteria bacterium]